MSGNDEPLEHGAVYPNAMLARLRQRPARVGACVALVGVLLAAAVALTVWAW
jgi:hypothetical protein